MLEDIIVIRQFGKIKMENSDGTLIKEYHERNVRWTNESLKHLSFYNNLLLALSVGFLSFSFDSDNIGGLSFTTTDVNWSLTFLIISLTSINISILIGLVLAIYRLQDFNQTRKLNQIRQRMLEHSKAKFDEATPDKFSLWRRLTFPFQEYPDVTMEECKTYQNMDVNKKDVIKLKFRELRNITHNFGIKTWRNIKLQTLYFGLSIFAYLLSLLTR